MVDDSNDVRLVQAWDQFCDSLKAAKAMVFTDTAPVAAKDRAAGIRMLARNIALALDMRYENADVLHPELTHYFDWRRKQGGDNPDALYLGAAIDGNQTYRISGTQGSAAFLAFTVTERSDANPWGGAPVGTLLGNALQADSDGRFDLFLGPEPQGKNWLRTTPETSRITIRQFFNDWENEQAMVARIDRLGAAVPPPEIAVDSLVAGLRDSAQWLNDVAVYWVNTLSMWQKRPFEFLSFRQMTQGSIDATPGGEPFLCYWELAADEALIIRVVPPRAVFWNFEFGNWWMETMDYRYRLAGTNGHYAVLENDGELIQVVAHDDPGVSNWLDASGYSSGYLACRWMGADSAPQPMVERVKLSELFSHLPPSVRRIDVAGRQEQLAVRRRGIMRRFAGI